MRAALMTDSIAETSPRMKASITAIFYLVNVLAFVPAAYLHSKAVINVRSLATTTETLAHMYGSLARVGFQFDLVALVSYVAITALFYDLFKPVNSTISLLAAYVSLAGCATSALSCLFHLVPPAILRAARSLPLFTTGQCESAALLFLDWKAQTADIGIVFFGIHCLLIGYLIFRSTFLPRALGVLMAVAGLAWLTFLSPALATSLSPFNCVIGLLGEGSLMLWLLLFGVNAQRWNEAAVDLPGQR